MLGSSRKSVLMPKEYILVMAGACASRKSLALGPSHNTPFCFHPFNNFLSSYYIPGPSLPFPILDLPPYPKPSPPGDQRTTRKASIHSFKSEISKWCPTDWIWSTDVFCLANMIFFFKFELVAST